MIRLSFARVSALALVLLVGCGGGTPAMDPDAGTDTGPTGQCTRASDCDDGRFCNGIEGCNPSSPSADARGCVPPTMPTPCMAGQTCDETTDRCTTQCAVTEDADADGARAMECGGTDCDDADARRYPGNTEVCDLAAHDEDCNPSTFGDRDLDGDGAIDAQCCNGTSCGTDCNDLSRSTNPSAPEVCDHLDNDCDTAVDEGSVTVMVWPDGDFDLHGDAHATPRMECAGTFGTATVGDDCDDTNPAVQPAQVEICDALDNDCDGNVDEAPSAVTWYVDADGDGFGSGADTRVSCTPLPGYSLRSTDCDDMHAGVSPAQVERCDGLDNDCNGRPDYVLGPRSTEDDDLDGAADLMCPHGTDCDDDDPTSYPGAAEVCDGRDNDCNAMVDDGSAMGQWYPDRDGDTFGDASATPVISCSFVRGSIPRGGDCDDSSDARRPGATEVCNGVDDDCDTLVDESSDRTPYYLDQDGDGFGAGTPLLACSMPPDRVANALDCDDTTSSIGAARLWFVDADADGYGDPLRSTLSCTMPTGRISRGGDCDDTTGTTHPMATERCNGTDEDCDLAVDETPAETSCTAAHATAACTAGACAVGTCATGYQDCNTTAADGCEVSTDTDPANCGSCGHACAIGEACRAGGCAAIVDVALGYDFVCALLATGRVGCWGNNPNGQLGRGVIAGPVAAPPTSTSEYVQLYTMDVLSDAIAIDAHPAGFFACALRSDHTVWCWGATGAGQIGLDAPPVAAPRAYPVRGVTGATAIAVGATHACAIVGTGSVLCWGDNAGGRLGSGSTTPTTSPTPLPMVQLEGGVTGPITDAAAIVASQEQTCVLHAGASRVSCAGRDGSGGGWGGQLGRGTITGGSYPVADDVSLPAGLTISALRAGTEHFCVMAAGRSPICWGLNVGQIQPGPPYGVPTPLALDVLLSNAQEISLGDDTTCTRYVHPTRGVRFACAGADLLGELADGVAGANDPVLDDMVTAADRSTFLTAAQHVYMGHQMGCALLDTGRLTCWGNNNYRWGVSTPPTRGFVDLTSSVPNVP